MFVVIQCGLWIKFDVILGQNKPFMIYTLKFEPAINTLMTKFQ